MGDSQLNVTGNEVIASSADNNASATISSSVLNDDIGIASALVSAQPVISGSEERTRAESSAQANLAIATSQTSDQGTLTARIDDGEGDAGRIGVTAEDVDDSELAVRDNDVLASGFINESESEIDIGTSDDAGTNMTSASSGISLSQVATRTNLTAAVDLDGSIDVSGEGAGTVTDSSLTLSGNRQRAIATGNAGENTITASVNDMQVLNATIGENAAPAPRFGYDGTSTIANIDGGTERLTPDSLARAGHAISSSQVITGAVTEGEGAGSAEDTGSTLRAIVDGDTAGFRVDVEDDVLRSSVTNDENVALASVTGNTVSNEIDLDANSIQTFSVEVGESDTFSTTSSSESDEIELEYGDEGEPQTETVNTETWTLSGYDGDDLEGLAAALGGEVENGVILVTFTDLVNEVENEDGEVELEFVEGGSASDQLDAFLAGLEQGRRITLDGENYAFGLVGEENGEGELNFTGFNVGDRASGTIAAIASSQYFDAEAEAVTLAESDVDIRTDIGGDVIDSSVSTSANQIIANATANTGDNTIRVTANELDTTGTPGISSSSVITLPTDLPAEGKASTAISTAGITLSSTQLATGSVSARLTDPDAEGEDPAAAAIQTTIGGGITDSTVRSDDNLLSASVVGNEITPETNLISIGGEDGDDPSNRVATSTALSNLQVMSADLDAEVGAAGSPGTPPETLDVNVTIGDGESEDIDVSGFSEEAVSHFEDFFDNISNVTASVDNDTLTLSFNDSSDTGAYSPPSSVTYQGTPPTPGAGGVNVIVADDENESIAGDIERATVTVDGNETSGSVTGNIATNRTTIEANALERGSAVPSSRAGVEVDGEGDLVASAFADHSLANVQLIQPETEGEDAPRLTTDVSGTFSITSVPGIRGQDATDIVDSRLSVSGNEQYATTRGNVASNEISLSATNMETGAALVSLQGADADIEATSNMDVYAPAANLSSTLDMNDNWNQAVATMNQASNMVSVEATNYDSITSGWNATLENTIGGIAPEDITQQAIGDNVVNNIQSAETSVESTATTQLFNLESGRLTEVGEDDDVAPIASSGIVDSSVNVDRNVTISEAMANRSTNQMQLDGGSSFDGTGGVQNNQYSTADVTATATTVGVLDVEGNDDNNGDEAASDSSSVSMSDNATVANARGNTSTSLLNGMARSFDAPGHQSGGGILSAQISATSEGTSSTFGVLNAQTNSGSVQANATADYTATYRDGGSTNSVINSRGSVNDNVVQASAVGNASENGISLSALDHGNSSAATGNRQINTGDVQARASATVGTRSNGNVNGSRLSTSGNSVSASATGNSARSSVTRN